MPLMNSHFVIPTFSNSIPIEVVSHFWNPSRISSALASVKAVGSMEELSAQFLVMFVAICKHLKSLQHKEKWKGFHSEGTGFLVWRPVFCGCSCFRLCPCTLESDFERLQNSEAATSVPIFTFPSCPDFLMAWECCLGFRMHVQVNMTKGIGRDHKLIYYTISLSSGKKSNTGFDAPLGNTAIGLQSSLHLHQHIQSFVVVLDVGCETLSASSRCRGNPIEFHEWIWLSEEASSNLFQIR